MKNKVIELQICNLELTIENFINSLEISALKDDGVISRDEEKIIRKLKKASGNLISRMPFSILSDMHSIFLLFLILFSVCADLLFHGMKACRLKNIG